MEDLYFLGDALFEFPRNKNCFENMIKWCENKIDYHNYWMSKWEKELKKAKTIKKIEEKEELIKMNKESTVKLENCIQKIKCYIENNF